MKRDLINSSPIAACTRRSFGCLVAVSLIAQAPAHAAGSPELDAIAVRKVIEGQLKAFAADNAALAFSFASPSIKAQFVDANNFMAMVRRGYPMILRHASVSFLQARAIDVDNNSVSQSVHLIDRAGGHWRATYLVERLSGVKWTIGGCVVAPESGKSFI